MATFTTKKVFFFFRIFFLSTLFEFDRAHKREIRNQSVLDRFHGRDYISIRDDCVNLDVVK